MIDYWFDNFFMLLCELPDRNSPEGEPNAIVATKRELRNCLESAMEAHKSTLTDDQCNDFRRLPLSFNDMVRAIYNSGIQQEFDAKESVGKVIQMPTFDGHSVCHVILNIDMPEGTLLYKRPVNIPATINAA